MANYAYLRVSTDQQDLDNQRHGILEYANQQGISGLQFVEDTVSGKVKWGELKQKASKFHRFLALPYPLMRVLLIFSQTGIGLPIENTVSRTISENPKALILRVCS